MAEALGGSHIRHRPIQMEIQIHVSEEPNRKGERRGTGRMAHRRLAGYKSISRGLKWRRGAARRAGHATRRAQSAQSAQRAAAHWANVRAGRAWAGPLFLGEAAQGRGADAPREGMRQEASRGPNKQSDTSVKEGVNHLHDVEMVKTETIFQGFRET